jgi:hypothetical protein
MLEALIFAAAATAAFDTEVIPKAQADIATACGTRPNLQVRWKAFGDDDAAASALIATNLGFLTTAFSTVCKDEAAKAAMAAQVKKVVLTQAHGAADPVIYISEGTLNIEYLWVKGEPAPDANIVAAEIKSRLAGEEMEAP